MSQSEDLVTRPWVVAIALASLLAGVFIQQIFFAFTLGPIINNPTNPNGNGDNTTTTTVPVTTTTPVGISHFEIVPNPTTGDYYKKGYYQDSGQYYLRFFEITVREMAGSSGTVIIKCLVEDKYGNAYQQEFHESFNARQEKILEFKIPISETIWSNDEIEWGTSSVTLVSEY